MLLLAVPAPAAAGAAARGANEAISFSPAIVFVEAAPGRRAESSVLVQNQTSLDIRVRTAVLDMADGRGRSLDFVPPGSSERGAGAWIRPATERFALRAASERRVAFTVTVPAATPPGGYFGAVSFTARDPNPQGQVPIDVSQPIPVYVTVRGGARRQVRASAAPTEWVRWRGGTATWRVTVHNAGELHEVVEGRLHLDGVLSAPRTQALRPAILLPGERRSQLVRVQLRDAPDLVEGEPRLEGVPGTDAPAENDRLLVLPWWMLVLLVSILAVIWWRLGRRRRWGGGDGSHAAADASGSPG